MPITKQQFDLGIDAQIERWMEAAYDFLHAHKALAYSLPELAQEAEKPTMISYEKFQVALDRLMARGAIEARTVADTTYYAFANEIDKDSWQRKTIKV